MTLLREWNQKCQPPWEEKDLKKKLRDARAKVNLNQPMQPRENVPALGTNEAVDDPHRSGRALSGQESCRRFEYAGDLER